MSDEELADKLIEAFKREADEWGGQFVDRERSSRKVCLDGYFDFVRIVREMRPLMKG